jgi:hypothetical protein
VAAGAENGPPGQNTLLSLCYRGVLHICEDEAMPSELVRDAGADYAAWLPKLKKDPLVSCVWYLLNST